MSLTRLLQVTFALSCAGVGVELLLLEHFEDWRQWIPIVLLGLGIITCAWRARAPSVGSERAFGGALLLMAASGIVGQVLHIRGNMEFELESDPAIGRWPLFVESMMGATPALAPGTMVLLAAVGYAWLVAERARRQNPSG
jgi:hypothetical protein